MKQNESNIYFSLQQLIWSTFVGVLSFQLIAPYAWGYINNLLGGSYQQAYTSFIFLYSVILPVLILLWIQNNLQELKAFPFDNGNEVNPLSKLFLTVLRISFMIQILGVIVFLSFRSKFLFVFFQIIVFIVTISLLIIGALIAIKRIQHYKNKEAQTLTLNKDDKKLTLKLQNLVAYWAFFVIVVLVFGSIFWIKNNGNYSLQSSVDVDKGFEYLTARKTVDDLLKKIDYKDDYFSWKRSAEKFDSLKNKNSVPIDVIKKIRIPDRDQELEKDQLDSKRLVILKNYLRYTSSRLLSSSQSIIGNELRDNQLKITFTLLNIFLCLFSVYVFYQVDATIKKYFLEDVVIAKRLDGDDKVLEAKLLNWESRERISTGLLNGAWFYITISIWLLVPLLKPIEDEKIDPKTPFRTLTLSRPDPIWETEPSSIIEYTRVENSFNNSFDSLVLSINHTNPPVVVSPADLTEVMIKLNSISDSLDTVRIQNTSIKNKVKYLVPGKQ